VFVLVREYNSYSTKRDLKNDVCYYLRPEKLMGGEENGKWTNNGCFLIKQF
jgi:hypothetical protein